MRKLSHDLAVLLTGTLSREMKAEETHLTANSAGTAAQTQASPRDEHTNDANTLCAGTSVALKTEVLKKEELLGHEIAWQVQGLSTHPW